jgi:hypothetical protein
MIHSTVSRGDVNDNHHRSSLNVEFALGFLWALLPSNIVFKYE